MAVLPVVGSSLGRLSVYFLTPVVRDKKYNNLVNEGLVSLMVGEETKMTKLQRKLSTMYLFRINYEATEIRFQQNFSGFTILLFPFICVKQIILNSYYYIFHKKV